MEIKDHVLIRKLDQLAESLPIAFREDFYGAALGSFINGYEFADARYENRSDVNLRALKLSIVNYLKEKSKGKVNVPLRLLV
ncbi:hypothetical protein J4422_00280 [Candidatus Pacearchaeota archaeon]|nr:hypothetical protein [Candidatus Pacearchaeota archaeon]